MWKPPGSRIFVYGIKENLRRKAVRAGEFLGVWYIFFTKYLEVSDLFRTFVPNQAIGLITTYMRLRVSVILLLLSFANLASAENYGYSKNHQLIFGIDMDYPPLQYVDEGGVPHGLDIEFTKRLMNRLYSCRQMSPQGICQGTALSQDIPVRGLQMSPSSG